MIICICNNINTRGVSDAIESGASSPDAVQAHHGCAFNCGACQCEISDMLNKAHDDAEKSAFLIAAE